MESLSNNPLMDNFLAAETLVRSPSGHELTKYRRIYVKAIPEPESDSSQPTSDESDEDDTLKPPETTEEEAYMMDYMNIQKLIRLLQKSNISASIVTLSCLLEYDLSLPLHIKAIRNCGGLEYLLNIVSGSGEHIRARNMALLAIVNLVENNVPTRRHVVNLGGVEVLVEQLDNPGYDLQVLACEGLFHLAKGRNARRAIRIAGGINRLVDRLRQPLEILNKPKELCSGSETVINHVYEKSAWTLRALAVGSKNRRRMMAEGIVEEMERALQIRNNYDAILPMVSCIMEFCSDKEFHIVLEKNKIIYLIIRNLANPNYDMKYICANSIFKCGDIPYLREIIHQEDALFHLVDILHATDMYENKNLMIATTGAIWKCAIHTQSKKRLFQLGVMENLVGLLTDPRKRVVTNVMGAIYELSKEPKVKALLKRLEAIPVMINRLFTLHDPLLANTVDALGECAKDKSLMDIIESADGFRLVFSQIKNPNKEVHRRAALALVPFILNGEDSGETVRNIDLGMPYVIELLEISDDPYVLGAVCSCIATIALDNENLACMSEAKIVKKLYKLLDTKNSYLRTHLCTAIGNCCGWGRNARHFGCLGTIPKIVDYMMDLCKDVHRTAVYAMARLSREPSNCVRLHRVSATVILLLSMSSTDDELKISAAECMRNIRRLGLRVERAIFGRDTI